MLSWKQHFSRKKLQNNNKAKDNKRASFFVSTKGAMTLEASLILPLVLIVLLLLVSASDFYRIHGEVAHGLKEAAVETATNEYMVGKKVKDGSLVARGSIKATFLRYADGKVLSHGVLGGKAGVSVAADVSQKSSGELQVTAHYIIRKKYPFLPAITGYFTQKIRQKNMTGYDPKGDEGKQGTVYITPHESVYHKDTNCTHLNLTISATTQVEKYLQGKTSYHPCERCTKYHHGAITTLFVPKEGDAYHTDITCSGLKRSVQAVDLSELKGVKPCTRCGK